MENKIDNYLKSLKESLKNLQSSQNSEDCDFTDDMNCQDVVESEIEDISNNLVGLVFTKKQQRTLRMLLNKFDGPSCSFKQNVLKSINY